MSDFEREIVHCLNRFFKTHHIQGFAYRLKQHSSRASTWTCSSTRSTRPITSRSSASPSSIRNSTSPSTSTSDKNKVHQVDAISDFLAKTGRIGYLAVEFRQGPGKAGEAFLIPWPVVVDHFRANKGITIEDARSCIVLARSKDGYLLESLNAK